MDKKTPKFPLIVQTSQTQNQEKKKKTLYEQVLFKEAPAHHTWGELPREKELALNTVVFLIQTGQQTAFEFSNQLGRLFG